jgi:hypothetical protein
LRQIDRAITFVSRSFDQALTVTHSVPIVGLLAAFEAAIAAFDPNVQNRSSHAHTRLARKGRPSYPQPVR